MVPPRLTIVPSGQADSSEDDAARPPQDVAPASPVHDLIATIETGAATGALTDAELREKLRVIEAMLFASSEPLTLDRLALNFRSGEDVADLLSKLQAEYANRGVNLVCIAGKWAFRTAETVSWALERHAQEERRLSKAAIETLAIVAYHQPVTRAEIEEVRGVSISKGTLDVLMETGWVRPRGRRRAPGKPITYGTTDAFLSHFGLESVKDLPGLTELKGSGLLDANLPPDFKVPEPTDVADLMPDELPLDAGDEEDMQTELALDDSDRDEDYEDVDPDAEGSDDEDQDDAERE